MFRTHQVNARRTTRPFGTAQESTPKSTEASTVPHTPIALPHVAVFFYVANISNIQITFYGCLCYYTHTHVILGATATATHAHATPRAAATAARTPVTSGAVNTAMHAHVAPRAAATAAHAHITPRAVSLSDVSISLLLL